MGDLVKLLAIYTGKNNIHGELLRDYYTNIENLAFLGIIKNGRLSIYKCRMSFCHTGTEIMWNTDDWEDKDIILLNKMDLDRDYIHEYLIINLDEEVK